MKLQQLAAERIILGIDPGTLIMGFGVIKVTGKTMTFVQMNELDMRKITDPYVKLRMIFERTMELIETHHPDEIALEAPFFGKNVQSMLKLGRALSRDIPVTEYAPRRIKQSITGKGTASKEQVALMLQSTLNLKELPKNLDMTDGLAAAVCHFYSTGRVAVGKSYSGWASFVKQNEKRVKK
jgi:crossover junction endodeoxyribonuclease RuvC